MDLLGLLTANFILFLPAYVANSVPLMVARLNLFPKLNRPLDGGLYWQEKRVLGDHKTVRGLIVGVGCGLLVGYVLANLIQSGIIAPPSVYISWDQFLLFSWLISFGALVGDAGKSFFKRRMGIKPGKPWLIADQIDFILGVLLFTLPFYKLTIETIAVFVMSGFVLHILAGIFSKLVHFKEGWI